jgi:hypothetical protein
MALNRANYLDGVEQGELFIRIQPQHPERTQEGARAVNAFDAGRWEELDALSIGASIDRIVAFHDEIARDKSVLPSIRILTRLSWIIFFAPATGVGGNSITTSFSICRPWPGARAIGI